MPRHRAPSAPFRSLASLAAGVTALSAPLVTAVPAVATPLDHPLRHCLVPHGLTQGLTHAHHGNSGHSSSSTAHCGLRPMTSGEEQYRNGCHDGYISDHCERFSVPTLIRHGIDPFV